MVLTKEQINRWMDRTEEHKYSQWIFDRGAKAINEAKIVFSTNSAGRDIYTHTQNESHT